MLIVLYSITSYLQREECHRGVYGATTDLQKLLQCIDVAFSVNARGVFVPSVRNRGRIWIGVSIQIKHDASGDKANDLDDLDNTWKEKTFLHRVQVN